MSDSTSEQSLSTIDWGLWFQWVLATTLGWGLGWALSGEIMVGIVLGSAQWLVLRQFISPAGWWIWATTIGWAVAWALIANGILPPPESGVGATLLAGAVLGLMVGVAQWFVLRHQFQQAGWWVLFSVIGWMIGLTGILGSSVTGAVVGAVTGFALDWLLRTDDDDDDM